MKKILDVNRSNLSKQEQHWEKMLSSKPEMFGDLQSHSASKAAEVFMKEGVKNILELGAGQGRDTMFFAQSGIQVQVLDYSESGVKAINEKADRQGLSKLVIAKTHDIRNPLPFENETFDACYSHMLYCMALTTKELEYLNSEIRRVLKPNGLNIYTVRHVGDADYVTGIHQGEDMYEVGGFIVHFFSKEKVEQLSKGYEIVEIDEFEEGSLPRKLFRVTMRKKGV